MRSRDEEHRLRGWLVRVLRLEGDSVREADQVRNGPRLLKRKGGERVSFVKPRGSADRRTSLAGAGDFERM